MFHTRVGYLALQIFLWLAGDTVDAKSASLPVVSWDDSQQVRLSGDWSSPISGESFISAIVTRKVMYLQSSENLPEASLLICKMEDNTVHSVRCYDSIRSSICLNDCGPGIYLLELKGHNGMHLSGKFLLE
ncbi:MAG: DUF3244 domain-containing protein [Bacteroides sp.]|nr:DUF3244 domain-containing protein [Bacteroides sp.]